MGVCNCVRKRMHARVHAHVCVYMYVCLCVYMCFVDLGVYAYHT